MIPVASRRPTLPRPLALPLRLLPGRAHSALLAAALNRLLGEEIAAGELDFLEGRSVRIQVSDAGLSYDLRFSQGSLQATSTRPDLHVTGSAYDFMLLASGREDADTLFFQRQLRMQGSTDLGVHLKNFLASIDLSRLPLSGYVLPGMERVLRLYERLA